MEWRKLYLKELDIYINVSDEGNLQTFDRYVTQTSIKGNEYTRLVEGKELCPYINGKAGYSQIGIHSGGIQKKYYVHRLVWIAFNGEIPEGYEIDHDDNDKSNNALRNLNLITRKENMDKMLIHRPYIKENFIKNFAQKKNK